MKSLISFSLLALSLSASAYFKEQDMGNHLIYDIAVDSIELKEMNIDDNVFQRASFLGVEGHTGIHYQLGAYEVPVIRFMTLANEASDIEVVVRNLNQKAKKRFPVANLFPIMKSVAKNQSGVFDIPENPVAPELPSFSVKEMGSIRGQKSFEVTLYPAVLKNEALSLSRSFSVMVKKPIIQSFEKEAMVMIVGSQFSTSPDLWAYVDFKRSRGMDVVLQYVVPGDAPEKIRADLKNLYQQKPELKYVLIIGDAEDVPGGETTSGVSGTTDHYYAAIDTDDYVSDLLTPDVQVGRFSVSNLEQLKIVLDKSKIYTTGAFTTLEWLKQISFLATDDQWELAEGTHNYVIENYTKDIYTGAFPSVEAAAGGDKLYAITNNASGAEALSMFNQGRSIIDYSGHGHETGWDGPSMEREDIRALTSTSLPFVISNACLTGHFLEDESFAETWQRHPAGAIAYWGTMYLSYWDEDDILERRMFDGIFKDHKKTFGAITQNALLEVSKFYNGEGRSNYYFELYHLFGDPSIEIKF